MTRLIEDLMDVSRISRGKVELRREFVSLTAVVESAIEASRPLIENNGQTLEINISDDPITLNADPARIAQVTSNLLNNASKYSNPGDRIWLTVDSDDESAKITIRDEGIGIAPDEIDDVFKMFTQVAESVERGSSGLGIGLTLVSNFVDMHGGTVTVTSEGKGKGSCFNVTLPLADPSAVADAREPEVATSTPIRQFNILVVDDTRAITFVMERLLKELGQEVRTAENGLTAIEVLTNFQPDLIFSDISMPGMNGYELAKHIRGNEASKHMRMIAMTGFGQPTDRTRAIDAGFDDHVVKPVDYSVIEDVLRRFSTETADD
jgi:CheY-like chemotaxis protein